jgi:hypothetical protein
MRSGTGRGGCSGGFPTDGETLDAPGAGENGSGVKTDRSPPARLLAGLEDVLTLDRLASSTRDLPNVLATISERGAGFRSLSDQGRLRRLHQEVRRKTVVSERFVSPPAPSSPSKKTWVKRAHP